MPRKPASWRTNSTTSCEVRPLGFLTIRRPSMGGGLGGRGIFVRELERRIAEARGVAASARRIATRLRSLPRSSFQFNGRSGLWLLRRAGFVQQFVDAFLDFLGLIEREDDFRRAAHVQALDKFVAHESARGFEALDRLFAFFLGAIDADENADRAHAGADADFGDGDVSGDARVF